MGILNHMHHIDKGNSNEEFEGDSSMTTAHTLFGHLTTFWRYSALSLIVTLAACNSGGGSSASSADISLFAGNLDSKGNVDGTGSAGQSHGG